MGALAHRIAPGRLYALDFSGEMLRKAIVRRIDYPVVMIHAFAEDIPMPDHVVDRVIMINTFSQFPRPDLVISEISRVLRKGGKLDIRYFFDRNDINSHHDSNYPRQGLGIPDDTQLQNWFDSAGFTSSIVEGKGVFHLAARFV